MDDHAIAVGVLSAFAEVLFGNVRAEMHGRGIVPKKERLLFLRLLFHPGQSPLGNLLVDCFHALLGEGAGVDDCLSAFAIREAMKDPARAELFLEFRILGVIREFRFFFGVQVIKIAEEFIEPVHGRKELVPIAEMVLAELSGRIPERLQQFGYGRVFLLQADSGARHADLGQASADRVLAGDEAGTACRTALLGVVVRERYPFGGDPVDVGGAVAHHAAAEVADVPDANVVSPQDQDVRLA